MATDFDTSLVPPGWARFASANALPATTAYGFLRRIGAGALGGSSPGGLTTLLSAPVAAQVRVSLRSPTNPNVDGVPLQIVVSAGDGTWEVIDLPSDVTYDVVGRLAAENDVIVADVTPI